MIRVLEEERSVRFYKSALDLDIANRFDFDGFTLVYLRNRENDVEIELTINHDRDRPYDLGDGGLRADEGSRYHTGADQGVLPRRSVDGSLLFHHRSRWISDRGPAAPRTIYLTRRA
jgi:catechol 2,3-dioxygenase-like lactoylglutathione lyase family enzyme